VCFSSVASVLGAQGRAHYGAANAFLDVLALERRRLGLSATTINWGPWRGGGMATLEQLEQFERMGNRGLEPEDALRALDSVVTGGDVQTVVADVDWDTFRTVYEARRPGPILTELLGREPQAQKTSKSGASAPWIEVLRAIPAAQRVPNLVALLRREVAETLGFDDPESVPVDRNFYEIGMDSLMMADLVSRLTKRLGRSYNAVVFDHPNVRSLAIELIQRLPLEETPTPAPPSIGGLTASASEQIPPPALAVAALGSLAAQAAGPEKPITGYEATAESEIFSFQARAWPHRNPDLIPARWRWMFVDSAHRLGVDTLCWLYRDHGRIVGHMGSIAVRVKLGDEQRQTGWLVDTMVLEEYRNQGVGPRLMVDAHEDQPFSLSLGQTVEMREIQLRLGWKQVAPLQVARLLVRPEKTTCAGRMGCWFGLPRFPRSAESFGRTHLVRCAISRALR
jgi:acyl carrier protein/GNAT superfamily N-acetyltransferase